MCRNSFLNIALKRVFIRLAFIIFTAEIAEDAEIFHS